MITAQEARELYDQSGAEVKEFLECHVENRIKTASTSGKKWVFILVDCEPAYKNIQPTAFNLRVMDALKGLGYTVRFGFDGDAYVPRGLADDQGLGPMHRNYGYTIGW